LPIEILIFTPEKTFRTLSKHLSTSQTTTAEQHDLIEKEEKKLPVGSMRVYLVFLCFALMDIKKLNIRTNISRRCCNWLPRQETTSTEEVKLLEIPDPLGFKAAIPQFLLFDFPPVLLLISPLDVLSLPLCIRRKTPPTEPAKPQLFTSKTQAVTPLQSSLL
jgi:hypothetical protein